MNEKEVNKLYRKGRRKAIRNEVGIFSYCMRIAYPLILIGIMLFIFFQTK